MSVTRPSVYPEWASEDVIDPTSGQNNVVTPPSEKMTNGWDLREFPPRQWFNWLGRYTYLWIQYLDQQSQTTQVNDGTGASSTFPNFAVGGLATLSVVDAGNPANSYFGMAYIPPNPGSPVTLIQIGPAVPTFSTISITGVVTVSGGTGPYVMQGTLNNIPA